MPLALACFEHGFAVLNLHYTAIGNVSLCMSCDAPILVLNMCHRHSKMMGSILATLPLSYTCIVRLCQVKSNIRAEPYMDGAHY